MELGTYLNRFPERVIKVHLARVRIVILVSRLHGDMNMRSASRIVARKDGIEADGAEGSCALETSQEAVGLLAILAGGVGMPYIDLNAL